MARSSRPARIRTADGTLSLIVDSTTMSVLDVGLTDARDDLHSLGAVFQL